MARTKASRHARGYGYRWYQLRKIILANATHCAICHKPLDFAASPNSSKYPTVDHIVPLKKGGALMDPDNLRPAHHGCNSRRENLDRQHRRPNLTLRPW